MIDGAESATTSPPTGNRGDCQIDEGESASSGGHQLARENGEAKQEQADSAKDRRHGEQVVGVLRPHRRLQRVFGIVWSGRLAEHLYATSLAKVNS